MFCVHVCLCEGVRASGTGVTNNCELPCGFWELNPGHLEEHLVLLTADQSLFYSSANLHKVYIEDCVRKRGDRLKAEGHIVTFNGFG